MLEKDYEYVETNTLTKKKMENSFNISRYQELLKLKNNNKIALFDENSMELLKYQANVQTQVSYNRKKDYFILISRFLNHRLEIHQLKSKINDLKQQDLEKSSRILENFEELESFSLASDLEKFGNPINEISELCFNFYEYLANGMEALTEDEFYDLINKYYLQLQVAFSSTI